MILYFADRKMHILGQASTRLPKGLLVSSDMRKEDVETGSRTFECDLAYDDRKAAEEMTQPGNYLLRSADGENEFYTIIDSELDTADGVVNIYAEDAGLDLLNEVLDEYEASAAMTIAQYTALFAADSGFEIGVNEVSNLSRKLAWDSEMTATERLLSVAEQFGAEISYSFEIDRLHVVHKYINFWKKRGKKTGATLRMGEHISNIRIRKTVANLATALYVTGGTPEGNKGIHAYTDASMVEHFTWLKYWITGKGMQESASSANWIGLAWDKTDPVESDNQTAYTWQRIGYSSVVVVKTGSSGFAEIEKVNGNTRYTWIKFATSDKGAGMSDSADGKTYIGIARHKSSATKSTTASDYTWTLMRGSEAKKLYLIDNGAAKTDYDDLYAWIKYGTSSSGAGMANSAVGKTYAGLALGKSGSTESSSASDYIWTQITANTLSGGELVEFGWSLFGIKEAGKNTYTWIRYAENGSGKNMASVSTSRSFIGLAYGKASNIPSSNAADYSWHKIAGDDLKPITLYGYAYDDGDIYLDGTTLKSRSALAKWSRYLSPDETGTGEGHIIRQYSYDTTSQSELCSRGVTQLEKISKMEVNYEADVIELPEGVQVGDTVQIVDTQGELFLEARILIMETRASEDSRKITLGDYVIRENGLSEQLEALRKKVSDLSQNLTLYTWIVYADDDEGNGISFNPEGKAYMGTAANRVSEVPDLSDPTVYSWQKVTGERSAGIYKVTTAPSSHTTTIDGFTPSYRIALSTALSQSGASEIIVGDIIEYSYYHYPVGYVTDTYVYLKARTSIRGAKGDGGAAGENATSLKIDSSRGVLFKNNVFDTVLTVTIFKGALVITDAAAMHAEYGAGAYLQWYWRKFDDEDWSVMLVSDSHITNDGFMLTVTPDDVDEKIVFKCELEV